MTISAQGFRQCPVAGSSPACRAKLTIDTMSDRKHKSGYDLLKDKYSESEKKVNELQTIVERQQTHISQLTIAEHNARKDALDAEVKNHALWEHMGWFKRLTWELKQKK